MQHLRHSIQLRSGAALVVVILALSALACVGIALFFILRPTWDEMNRERILSMKTEADRLFTARQYRPAYAQYEQLIQFVGDRRIERTATRQEIINARGAMAISYSFAKAQIDAEEADSRRRAEEARRLETARQAALLAENQRVQEANRLRDEELKQQREAARLATELRARRSLFMRSPSYAALKNEAISAHRRLQTDLIGEDSAYRDISKSSRAARLMLGIYIRMVAGMQGSNVNVSIAAVNRDVDRALIGEDSAVRAIAQNDQGFFMMLGIWCQVLGGKTPDLAQSFEVQKRQLSTMLAGDDSAVRMSSTCTEASTGVLKRIVAQRGFKQPAETIANRNAIDNSGEDSAWRAAMRNAEANASLILLLLEQQSSDATSQIRKDAEARTIGDNSALRAHASYKRATEQALYQLITLSNAAP